MPINYLRDATSLSEYLERLRSLRALWHTKSEMWGGERVTRKGDEEALWFRGQPSKAKLAPKLYRKEYKDAHEAEIRSQFQSRAIQLMQSRVPEPDSKWDWYFLMQHYGAPTRLLDWTENPLIALFFAVDDQRNDGDASVWVLDPYWLNHRLFGDNVVGPLLPDWQEAHKYLKSLEDAFTFDQQVGKSRPAAIEPPHVDRRLAVQASRFVIFGKSQDMARISIVKQKKCRLAKIVIPRGSIDRVKEDLADCGVTYSMVYPDLEALGRELDSIWRKR
jgi:hypothetical protein